MTPASEIEATAKGLRRRGRTIIVQGVVSGLGVFVCDYFLGHQFNSGHTDSQIVLAILTLFFLAFLSRFSAWVSFTHLRRILRNSEWDEWYVRGADLQLFGLDVLRVVVLAHPEWKSEETRTLHPRKMAPDFSDALSRTLWVAGNPEKTLAVSEPGGASPVRALRIPIPKFRRAIKARVERANKR